MQDSADTVTKDLLVEPAKRGRKPLAAAVPVVADADLAPVAQAVAVLDERASRVRAVALQMGYQLPGDATDPDLIQRDIAANMRRSVEACLEVGRGLVALKSACGHGNFMARLEVLSLDHSVAKRFMQAATKFSKSATSHLLTSAIGSQSKLFEMLVLEDEQIKDLENEGQTGDLTLDDVATMSVKELRAALRKERGEHKKTEAVNRRLAVVNQELQTEAARIKTEPADEAAAALRDEATKYLSEAQSVVQGRLRAALEALNAAPDAEGKTLFMAGMVGQLMADLMQLRDEFNLPDVLGDGRPEWVKWAEKNPAAVAAETAEAE